ncbi:ABC transporter ATP-binding protein [Thermoproteota archaeon]
MKNKLIEVKDLTKYFPVKSGFFSRSSLYVHAVDGITFDIFEKETYALVGESGCGKTTTGLLLLRLVEPTSGSVKYMGRKLEKLSADEMHNIRRDMQIIFQDPFSSLNPRKTIGYTLGRPFKIYENYSNELCKDKALGLLELVGLTPPEEFINRFPHELSGGQRQRIAIGRAVALYPKFIVADEPVSSIDVSMRGHILKLMKKFQNELKITYLYITHDLSTVRSVCNTVAIMYLGKIVEKASVHEIFINPLHPYTEALFSATPIPDPKKTREREKIKLRGERPSPIYPPSGCRFHTRCPICVNKCKTDEPVLMDVGKEHLIACHLRY